LKLLTNFLLAYLLCAPSLLDPLLGLLGLLLGKFVRELHYQ
jgi:hypothetical protein